MKKKYFFLAFLISSFSYAQQNSKIKIDSAIKNEITVIQKGSDTIQTSDIDLSKSDSNKINVNQNSDSSGGDKEELKGFMYYATNTNTILSIIAALIIIVPVLFFYKKKSSRRK